MKSIQTQQKAVLAVVLISYFMIIIDASIVITGLDKIQAELGFSDANLAWMQDSYLLVFGGLLLLGGRLGDISGRKKVLIAGLAVFTFASVIVGVAPAPVWAITGRALQGLGSAVVAPSTLALLSITFPEGPARTRALAWYATTAGVAASIGLVVGGIFADWTWRAGFFINLPLGIFLILGAARYLDETEKHSGQFDLAGAISSTLGMSSLVFGTVHSAEAGWRDPLTMASMLFGIFCLALYIFAEKHAKQPITPLRLFRNKQRAAVLIARFLYLGAAVSFWFFTSLYLQGVAGLSPTMTGIAFLPMTLCNFASALTVPYITRRFGNDKLLTGSILMSALGMAWLSQASSANGYLLSIALPMLFIGIGQGGALPSLTVAAVAGVSKKDAGAVSGLVNAVHQLGGAMGLAFLTSISASAGASLSNRVLQLSSRVETALVGGAVMLATAWILVLVSQMSHLRKKSITIEN